MGLKLFMYQTLIAIAAICFGNSAFAAGWSGPEILVTMPWGSDPGQVGVSIGDTIAYDELPSLLGVTENYLFISDLVNDQRILAISRKTGEIATRTRGSCSMTTVTAGSRLWCLYIKAKNLSALRPAVTDIVQGQVVWQASQAPSGPPYGFESTPSYAWFFHKYLYDTSGTLITTTTERPLELGVLVEGSSFDAKGNEYEFADASYVCGPKYPQCAIGLPRIGQGGNAVFVYWDGTSV